jgi:hypothetical protein
MIRFSLRIFLFFLDSQLLFSPTSRHMEDNLGFQNPTWQGSLQLTVLYVQYTLS